MRLLFSFFLSVLGIFVSAQSSDAFYKDAIELGKRGDYELALKKIDKAINLNPNESDYLNIKGLYYSQLFQFEEAFNAYTKAIEIDSNSIAYEGRGIVFDKLGKFDLAIQDHTMAITNADNNDTKYTGYSNRASAKMGKQDFQGAYDDLMIAYKFDESSLYVLTNLGAVCDEIGKGDDALKYLLKAIEVDSTYYPAFVNLGFKYQTMDEHSLAIKWFSKALEYDPSEPFAYSNRSYSKYKLGDLEGALLDIEKSIALYPENSYAYRTKALINLKDGKFEQACQNLSIALEKGFAISYGEEVANLIRENCR